MLEDPHLAGVAFTGATATACIIQQRLAARTGALVPLIAETGGQNAMIVDSSALPEQVVRDVITSAFNSAGQRCSALRVLFLQEDIADRLLALLDGAMAELSLGDPALLTTDIGPLIDASTRTALAAHCKRMQTCGGLHRALPLPPACEHGNFFSPQVVEIEDINLLEHEVFGPILHGCAPAPRSPRSCCVPPG